MHILDRRAKYIIKAFMVIFSFVSAIVMPILSLLKSYICSIVMVLMAISVFILIAIIIVDTAIAFFFALHFTRIRLPISKEIYTAFSFSIIMILLYFLL